MSHNYYQSIVSIKASDSAIISELSEQAGDEWNGESQCTMSDIVERMKVKRLTGCYTYSEAEGRALKDDFYWSGFILAIPIVRNKENTKIKNLQRRINDTNKKYADYIIAHRVADFKSSFIGCSECQSKINKDYFVKIRNKTNKDCCPVCGASMLSPTTKKILDGYKTKVQELEKEMEGEKKKLCIKPDSYYIIAGVHS